MHAAVRIGEDKSSVWEKCVIALVEYYSGHIDLVEFSTSHFVICRSSVGKMLCENFYKRTRMSLKKSQFLFPECNTK